MSPQCEMVRIVFITNIFLILDLAEKMENVTLNITSLSSVNPTDPIMLDDPLIQPGIFRKFIGSQLDPNTHYSISLLVNNKWLEIGNFQTGHKNQAAIGIIFLCLFFIFMTISTIFVFKRYKQIQETHQVNPNRYGL